MKYIIEKQPAKGRKSKCEGSLERHLYEPAVMLAAANWMFECGAERVRMYPDGMHAKQFNICAWLEKEGFKKVAPKGKTRDSGEYVRNRHTLIVEFKPGQGDIVAEVRGCRIVVEAKGGITNTNHAGQKSKLRKHIYEAVGMLLGNSYGADRLIAAVPRHTETEKIACKIAERCRVVGIEIALVSENGDVQIAG